MLFELESINNSDECHWILIKFGRGHGEYVLMLPCEYELNLRSEKKLSSLLSVCVFSAKKKKVNFFVSLNNFSLSSWIPTKFGSSLSLYVYVQSCENELNRCGIAFWWQLKGI